MASDTIQYDPEKVKGIYAETYASFLALPGFASERKFLRHRFELISKLAVKPLDASSSDLDLGCGLGIKTRILAEYLQDSHGVDFVDRCVQIASLLNDRPGLVFETMDATEKPENQFDVVTAFGLSVFNVSDPQQAAKAMVKSAQDFLTPKGWLLVYSFSDFSGKAPSGWYNHTRKELKTIVGILIRSGLKAQLVFPHRHFSNYTGNGLRHLAAEALKLVSRKRRDYYIVIEKP